MQGPDASGLASQWNIGFNILCLKGMILCKKGMILCKKGDALVQQHYRSTTESICCNLSIALVVTLV